MFIYCGDGKNNKIRILDTSDGITQEIDLLELKVLQSKGYEVKKDFSYNYSKEFIDWCKYRFKPQSFVIKDKVVDDTARVVLDYLLVLNNKFGVAINKNQVNDSSYVHIVITDDSVVFSFLYDNLYLVLVICNEAGIFTINTDILCRTLKCGSYTVRGGGVTTKGYSFFVRDISDHAVYILSFDKYGNRKSGKWM